MIRTTPTEFNAMMFCASHKFCNRCRNDKNIRAAIQTNHSVQSDGVGCPLGLKWDTQPKDLPETSRWECPGEPEHEHWLKVEKPLLDQLTTDMAFEAKYGRAAFLDMKILAGRAQDHEKEEAQLLLGIVPNSCRLKEKVGCNCKGGGWVVCHLPAFSMSGVDSVNEYTPEHLNLPPSARAAVTPEVSVAFSGDPAALDRARFLSALEAACFDRGNVTAVQKSVCDECWQKGAVGTRTA